MTTLARGIDAFDAILALSPPVNFGSLPAPITIESENLLVTSGDNATTISVSRGQNGTAAAAHALGTAVTTGWGSAGGSGVTVDNTVDAPFSATGFVAPGATESAPGVATLGAVQVFVADDDPGAVGAKNLWLQTDPDGNFNTLQLWVRNDADDGWFAAAAGNSYADDGIKEFGFWDLDSGREYAAVAVNAGTQSVTLTSRADPADTSTARSLRVDISGSRLTAGAVVVHQVVGAADPSAGDGVVAELGSLYQRNNSGTGELWLKTGVGDTAWDQVALVP